MTPKQRTYWHDIDWAKAHEDVKRLQNGIAVAYQNDGKSSGSFGFEAKLKIAQENLIHSRSAVIIAIRKVVSDPRKHTPGIDNEIWDTPEKKARAVDRRMGIKWKDYTASPVRRVYIPKAGSRDSVIPTRFDRAVQTLWRRALDPIAECRADRHSYGFRKFRSTKDARQYIFLRCARNKGKPTWIMHTDIKGFFVNIRHDWLVKNIPVDKHVLKQWLKSGALEDVIPFGFHGKLQPSEAGVRQGGSISPTFANLTLNGLEETVMQSVQHLKPGPGRRRKHSVHVHVVRYADDFVITSSSLKLLKETIKPKVNSFLKIRGLELNLPKTTVKKIDEGFDFLGYRFGRYQTKLKSSGKIFLVKPTKRNTLHVRARLRQIVKDNINVSAGVLISLLNPVIRIWCGYYSATSAKREYQKLGRYLWVILWRWALRKQPKLRRREIAKRYFKKRGNRSWIFFGELGGKEITIYDPGDTKIRRHTMVKDLNPYLPANQEYYINRERKRNNADKPWNSRVRPVLRRQKHICPVCQQLISSGDDVEVHHKLARKDGGKDTASNLLVLHEECHRSVTHAKSLAKTAEYRMLGVVVKASDISTEDKLER